MRSIRELFSDIIVAGSAVDRLELLVVGQLGAVEIPVAIDTCEFGMDRCPERLEIHIHRDLTTATLTDRLRIVVAHQTVVVLLCSSRRRGDHQKEHDRGNQAGESRRWGSPEYSA